MTAYASAAHFFNEPGVTTQATSPRRAIAEARPQVSSLSSTSPIMSVTSSSPSSCSSMKAASFKPASSSSTSSSASSSASSAPPITSPSAVILPWASASASSSDTNSASATSGATTSSSAAGLIARVVVVVSGRAACARRGKLKDGMAFRANDRVLVEIVKSRAATAAVALSTELEFHHGPVPLAVENGTMASAVCRSPQEDETPLRSPRRAIANPPAASPGDRRPPRWSGSSAPSLDQDKKGDRQGYRRGTRRPVPN